MATCSKCDGRGVRLMRPDAHGPSMCTACNGTGQAAAEPDALAGFRAQLIEHLRDTGYPGYADYLQTEFKHAAAENARLTAVVEAALEALGGQLLTNEAVRTICETAIRAAAAVPDHLEGTSNCDFNIGHGNGVRLVQRAILAALKGEK